MKMPVFSKLGLENFKSYRKEVQIEWMQITSILGLNGTGKSSIVDSIEFVFCFPKYSNMSTQRLKEEVCNKCIKEDDDPVSTWVRVTLESDEKEVVFQRTVCYREKVHKYSIDGVEVTSKVYKDRLLDCNINCRANNFLVQQNDIISIAMKGAKDRGEFIEHLCNSIAYKTEYINSKNELSQTKIAADKLKKELILYSKQKKKLTQASEELKMYDESQKELEKLEFDYYFAKLYKIDRFLDNLIKEKHELEIKVKLTQKLKLSTENVITELKSQFSEHETLLEELETESENSKKLMSEFLLGKSALTEKISYCAKKIKKIEENLINAKNKYEAHKRTIEDLNRQKLEVEEQREEYVSQSQMSSLELENDQYEAYLRLKSEALQKCAKEINLIASKTRERDSIKDRIDDYKKEETVLSERLKKEKLQVEAIKLKLQNIYDNIKETEMDITETENKRIELDDKEKENLIADIEILDKEIIECKQSKAEALKANRKREILRELHSNFDGVHDRLMNLCKVRVNRYQVSITKIMGNGMNDIVVQDLDTAKKCIRFLKERYEGEQFSAIETFLPLDYIQKIKPFDRKIIENEPNTVLALDVMDVVSDDYRCVLESVLKNVVICETDEQALGLSCRKKLNCVSLHGTYYKKDGSFSGGLADLLQKSKKWNETEMQRLKQEKQNKITYLREQLEIIDQKKTKISDLESKLSGLKKRLEQYLKPLYEEQGNELKRKIQNLSDLETKLKDHRDNIQFEELGNTLKSKNNELKQIESIKNKIENEIFADFCANFHLKSIQQYEQRDLNIHKERTDRKQEFDNLLDKINNEIECENTYNRKATVKKLQADLEKLKGNLQKFKEEESKLRKPIVEEKSDYTKVSELKSTRRKLEAIKKKIKSEEDRCKLMKIDMEKWNAEIADTKEYVAKLKSRKHELFMQCKINDINIPLCTGTLDNVLLNTGVDMTTESSESNSPSSNDSKLKEKDVEINYSKLNESIKDLNDDRLNSFLKLRKKEISHIREELKNNLPYFKSREELNLIDKQINKLKKNYDNKLKDLFQVKQKFDEVKNKRCTRFIDFFNSVNNELDKMFKQLYKDPAAQAHIIMKNPEEPYLDGIDFSCVVPKKKFIPMENLSGGEKTMCAMALLLAIYNVKSAPFLIFDEIDAALDNDNIKKAADFFLQFKFRTQLIIISHHAWLLSCADAAIGISISPRTNSSYLVHVVLGLYRKQTLTDKSVKATAHNKPASLRAHIEANYVDSDL